MEAEFHEKLIIEKKKVIIVVSYMGQEGRDAKVSKLRMSWLPP